MIEGRSAAAWAGSVREWLSGKNKRTSGDDGNILHLGCGGVFGDIYTYKNSCFVLKIGEFYFILIISH